MTAPTTTWSARYPYSIRNALSKSAQAVIAIAHNSLALLGLACAIVLTVFISQPDLRLHAETRIYDWLQLRQAEYSMPLNDPSAVERVTAIDPQQLPRAQAHVAQWLSRKYRVAQEPVSALVAEAYSVGNTARLDPTLILAVMAIESRFNPYAASPVGAQGLMQVLTRVHTDKYSDFGGNMAAFDPVSNLRVGAWVLRDAIKQAGSVEGGLKLYVGAVTTDGQDYVNKVLSEHDRLRLVAQGQRVAFNAYQRTAPATEPSPADNELEAGVTGDLPPAAQAKAS